MDRSWRKTVSLACCREWKYRGTAIVSNVPMMAITISSSISVKPMTIRLGALPVMVRHPVQPLTGRQRVHVKDVVARLRIIGRALIAAQSPRPVRRYGSVRKKRIARNTTQEVHVDFLLARDILDARVQRLQIRRVARVSQLPLDVTRIRSDFVRIERATYLAQSRPQLGFLLPLRHQLGQRHRRRGEQADDRERNDELDESEAARGHAVHGSEIRVVW